MAQSYDNPGFVPTVNNTNVGYANENTITLEQKEDRGNLQHSTTDDSNELNEINGSPNNGNNSAISNSSPDPCVSVSWYTTIYRKLYPRRGLFLTIGAALLFSGENILMEFSTKTLNIFQIGTMMSSCLIVLTTLTLLISKINIPKRKTDYISLLISGLLLGSGIQLALQSLVFMQVGDSVTIIYTMPIFAGIFSWIFLREPLRVIDFFFAFVSFGGVVLVAKPPFIFGEGDNTLDGDNPLLGAVFALGSAIAFALLIVAIWKLCMMGIHPVVILHFNAIVVFIISGIVCTALSKWVRPTVFNWLCMLGLGVFDFVGQITIYMALMIELAMFVSIIATSEVIYTFIWQIVFLDITPDWLVVIGAVLIVSSCIGLATKKEISTENETKETEEEVNAVTSVPGDSHDI